MSRPVFQYSRSYRPLINGKVLTVLGSPVNGWMLCEIPLILQALVVLWSLEHAGPAALRRMSCTVTSWCRDDEIRLQSEKPEELPHENQEKREGSRS